VTCEEAVHTLDAYVDRELEAAAVAAVREHLVGCPACRARAADREALGRLIRHAPYYAAPLELRARIVASVSSSAASSWRTWRSWASAAALVMAIGVGWMLGASVLGSRRTELVQEVVDGHLRSLQANHELDVASTDQHTVKPWFIGKLDFSPPVVDLEAAGFPLAGGRLDYVGGRAVAAIVYRRRQHLINVFVWPEASGVLAAGRWSRRGFQVQHWERDGMAYWAVSDLNDGELSTFTAGLRNR